MQKSPTKYRIQQHILKKKTHETGHDDQVGFIPGMKEWFNIQQPINVIRPVNKIKETQLPQLMQKKHVKN